MKTTYQIFILSRSKYDRGWRGGEAIECETGQVIAPNPDKALRDYLAYIGRPDADIVGDYAILDEVVYYADLPD